MMEPEIKKERKDNYKLYMIIPFVILAVCLAYVSWLYFTNSLNLDIDLKGGNQISIETTTSVNQVDLENALKSYGANVRIARGLTSYSILIDFDTKINPDDIIKALQDNGYTFKTYSVQTIGSTLSSAFFQQAITALIAAFILMAIAVLIIFRIPMPSFYVVLCGFTDLVETLAFSQFIGIKLSLATFAALLLLLGYSVDTDILLTTRVMKTADVELKKKIGGAMRTGLTMVGATAVALVALFTISISPVITQIASILLIGLVFDVLNTWVTNADLLRWYIERRGVK